MIKRNLSRLITFFLILIFCYPSMVLGEEKYEYISSEIIFDKLSEVGRLIEANKPKEARGLLDKIKALIGFEKSDHYLIYPSGIIRNIKIFESQINDAEGYYDDFAKFKGVIIEAAGIGNSGYFVVKDADEELYFIWEVDLIVTDECQMQVIQKPMNSKDDQHPWIGRKVKVYYDFHFHTDAKHPVKIIFHD